MVWTLPEVGSRYLSPTKDLFPYLSSSVAASVPGFQKSHIQYKSDKSHVLWIDK